MHLTSLNRFAGGKDEDVFRPQDFLDLDSQDDSDNEILAKFQNHSSKPDPLAVNILPPSLLAGEKTDNGKPVNLLFAGPPHI